MRHIRFLWNLIISQQRGETKGNCWYWPCVTVWHPKLFLNTPPHWASRARFPWKSQCSYKAFKSNNASRSLQKSTTANGVLLWVSYAYNATYDDVELIFKCLLRSPYGEFRVSLISRLNDNFSKLCLTKAIVKVDNCEIAEARQRLLRLRWRINLSCKVISCDEFRYQCLKCSNFCFGLIWIRHNKHRCNTFEWPMTSTSEFSSSSSSKHDFGTRLSKIGYISLRLVEVMLHSFHETSGFRDINAITFFNWVSNKR